MYKFTYFLKWPIFLNWDTNPEDFKNCKTSFSCRGTETCIKVIFLVKFWFSTGCAFQLKQSIDSDNYQPAKHSSDGHNCRLLQHLEYLFAVLNFSRFHLQAPSHGTGWVPSSFCRAWVLLLQKHYILTSLPQCSGKVSDPIPFDWKPQMAFIDPCVSSKAQSCTRVWQAGEGGTSALRCRVRQDQPGQGLVPTEPPFW